MDLTGLVTGSVAVVSIFVGLPAIVLNFINKSERNKIEKIKCQKELIAAETEKERVYLRLLEEENKKYDRLINPPPCNE
jgi:hypothetical protein